MSRDKRKQLRRVILDAAYTEEHWKRGLVQIGILQRAAVAEGFTLKEAEDEMAELVREGLLEPHSTPAHALTRVGADYHADLLRQD